MLPLATSLLASFEEAEVYSWTCIRWKKESENENDENDSLTYGLGNVVDGVGHGVSDGRSCRVRGGRGPVKMEEGERKSIENDVEASSLPPPSAN